jgi:hypothetical protein
MHSKVAPCQAALWFASQGHAVLPLHSITDESTCTCGKAECPSPGKHPYAPFALSGLKDATTDAGVICSWFAERYFLNYGVSTEKLLVIDADTKHDGLGNWKELWAQPTRALPHTWLVRTGGGGSHTIFDNTAAKIRCGYLAAGVQVKAMGGYVVGVTSKHSSGRTRIGARLGQRPDYSCSVKAVAGLGHVRWYA